MASKEFSDEELNYFRLCYVITRIIPEGLRTVFKQEWDSHYKATRGQWLDTAKNAIDLKNMESMRSRKWNARLLAIMANGNTSEWDCTCLFYAILYSNSLGPWLDPVVKKSVNELREVRNEVFAHNSDGSLTNLDFQDSIRKILAAFKNLKLNSTQVHEIKTQTSFPTEELKNIKQQLDAEKKNNAKFESFCILPPKPSHETTDRLDEVSTICQEMEKLRNAKKNETTAIYLSGNPGCGKSELARQIGEKYFNEISDETAERKFVFTFNASSIDTLLQSYLDFAGRLCDEDSVSRIATSKNLEPQEKIKSIRSLTDPKMQIYSSWLMIVDNVINLKLISKYLPQTGEKTSGDGQILVTTQDRQAIPCDPYTYHSTLSLGMKEEDAIALLSSISGLTSDKEVAIKITESLDFQPLALACAAIYMRRLCSSSIKSETNWGKYLLKLQEGKREATETVYTNTSLAYPATMTAAVRMALEREASEDKIMLYTFQFLSVIANEPIPLKYVVQYVINCMPDQDEDLVALHIYLSSLVISSENEFKEIRVHQVVYGCLQTNITYEAEGEVDILNLIFLFCDLGIPNPAENVSKLDIIATRSFVSHFVILSTKLQKFVEDHPSIIENSIHKTDCLSNVGGICLVHGSYKASEIYFQICLSIKQCVYHIVKAPDLKKELNQNLHTNFSEKRLEIQEERNPERKQAFNKNEYVEIHEKMANLLYNLSDVYANLCENEKAKIYLERALGIRETIHGESHPELARTLYSLGICHQELKEYEKAVTCLNRALSLHMNINGKNHSRHAAVILNRMAIIYKYQGQYEEATTYSERAPAMEEIVSDEHSPQMFYMLNNVGFCLLELHQYKKAKSCLEKALEVGKTLFHSNHPHLGITLGNLAVCLRGLREFENARTYLKTAVAIHENIHDDKNHRVLILTLNNFGSLLLELGEYKKAKSYLERALAIHENVYDNVNHQYLAITLNNLGSCLISLKQFENANTYLERALDIYENAQDKKANHQNLAATLCNLGILLLKLRHYENAKTYLERALANQEKVHDDVNGLNLIKILNNLGFCFNMLMQHENAKTHLERALAIHENREDNENHPDLAVTLNNLGSCLLYLRQHEHAKTYLEKALAIHENREDNAKLPDLAATLNNLGLCLLHLRQYKNAKTCLERALEIREKLRENENDPDLANTLGNLGLCLLKLKQYEKAKTYIEKALAIHENIHNNANLQDLANVLNGFGSCLLNLGDYKKAKTYLERAVEIHENEKVNASHLNLELDLACSLSNLGLCLIDTMQNEKAKLYLKRAAEIYENLDECSNDPEAANTLNNLGLCLLELGEYNKAQTYLDRALAIKERVFGVIHPELTPTLKNLALCLNNLRQYESAKTCLKRALAIQEDLHDMSANPLNLAKTLSDLCSCSLILGENEKAKLCLERSLAILENVHDSTNHRDLACTLNRLGSCHSVLGQYENAKTCLERALAIYESVHDNANHPDLINTLTNLGSCLDALGQNESAIPYLERAIAIHMDVHNNANHPDLAPILGNISLCILKLGEYNKAKPYMERAMASYERNYGVNHPNFASLKRIYHRLKELE